MLYFEVLYIGSFITGNSEVAKDAREQNKRHGENLWPHAHLRVKLNVHSRPHPKIGDCRAMYFVFLSYLSIIVSRNNNPKYISVELGDQLTPVALAATVKRDPRASQSLKLEKAACSIDVCVSKVS